MTNARATLSGTYTNPGSGNSERNTDEEAFPAGADVANNLFGQLGIGIKLTASAASTARARFYSAAAVTYA